ncbi:hypothetical protein JTB14_010737 [Gonioctena quinquepunctata]|nr:hypothetical protein JTB14_010737 [Gonioctena quinquepunctata]
MEKYLIVKDTVRKIRKFNLSGRTLEFKLRPTPKARALVVAKAYIDNDPDKRKVRDSVGVQTSRTLELLKKSGVEIPEEGGEKFQDYLSNYTITVYKYGNKGRDVLYEAKLPKAFGLDGVKKGYFPHLFNRTENWQYVGPLPALEYYDPEVIKYTPTLDEDKDPRKQLIAWHKELSEQGYVFDFQKELVEYCLVWEERQRRVKILHAGRGPEASIANMKVDGFCKETNQIFEFHGCPKCMKYKRENFTFEDPTATIESRYEATSAKTERLRALGYEVIEKWECSFRKELSENPELRNFCEKHPFISLLPLNPRDAFYGGRTDATRLYYKCKKGEKIKYVDVCSLYPFVNKYGKYPVGHPEVFVGDECNNLDLTKTDGVIKCKVLPSQNQYHAVLPVKMNDKLMFPLCRSCCEKMTEECTHSCEEERTLSGTWIIDEVLKALEKGYEIKEIYEVWKYKVVQYNPDTNSGGLFSEYISKILKIKQQASGWPSNCVTEQRKNKYISEYFDREGVSLYAEEIEPNPGCRQIGKAVITSFWGKLGQRENQQKTSIVTDPAEFFDILSRPFIEVTSIFPVNENTLIVNWSFKDEAYSTLSTVNVVLAAYTTAQARLKLYSIWKKTIKEYYIMIPTLLFISHDLGSMTYLWVVL